MILATFDYMGRQWRLRRETQAGIVAKVLGYESCHYIEPRLTDLDGGFPPDFPAAYRHGWYMLETAVLHYGIQPRSLSGLMPENVQIEASESGILTMWISVGTRRAPVKLDDFAHNVKTRIGISEEKFFELTTLLKDKGKMTRTMAALTLSDTCRYDALLVLSMYDQIDTDVGGVYRAALASWIP